jgi:F-type H+-transporting ATPase subunit a
MWFLAASAPAAHELPMAAPRLFHLGPLPITNSMIVTLIVAAVLIVVCQIMARTAQPVPAGFHNFGELVIEGLFKFLGDILGAKLARDTFWFFATLFIFILSLNWFGLLPGVGTIGWGVGEHWWHLEMTRPFLRGANADLNLPAAMSIVFFLLWIYWAFKYNGPVGVVKHIFGSKADFVGILGLAAALVFVLVGVLEVVSILIRQIALTFRLYGNVYGGEVMIDSMMRIIHHPLLGWIVPIPFYFYELMVGLVQALVFCLLCAVFTAIMCRHEEGHGEDSH